MVWRLSLWESSSYPTVKRTYELRLTWLRPKKATVASSMPNKTNLMWFTNSTEHWWNSIMWRLKIRLSQPWLLIMRDTWMGLHCTLRRTLQTLWGLIRCWMTRYQDSNKLASSSVQQRNSWKRSLLILKLSWEKLKERELNCKMKVQNFTKMLKKKMLK